MATLIIFVDALPFQDLAKLPGLRSWPWQAELQPGFGYSINLHAELFAGLTPDEVGFFGEWTFDPERAPGRRYARLLPLLDAMARPYLLNRGLQTILTWRYRPGYRMPNLPLARLADFAHVGRKVDRGDFGHPTLFHRHPRLQVVDVAGLRKGLRDAALFERAQQLIASGVEQLFVPLPDLDGIGHQHGTASAAWRAHLERIDGWAQALASHFLERHPRADVFLLSDHGMADVRQGLRLDLTRELGPERRDRYLTFTDSTLLRAWVFDTRLENSLAEALAKVEGLHVLSPDERAAFGLTSPAFGALIAVLEEGICFQPSTFARHIPRAMHGYHPDRRSQHGVLLYQGPSAPVAGVRRTRDVFAVLDQALQRG